MKRSEILENRKLVIGYLRTPGLRKANGYLGDTTGARCCLGHMTHALGDEGKKGFGAIKRNSGGFELSYGIEKEDAAMPKEYQEKLGMYRGDGGLPITATEDQTNSFNQAIFGFYNSRRIDTDSCGGLIIIEDLMESMSSLAEWNDQTFIRPKQIANYLESVIEGGDGTPWKPLDDYPE